MKFCSKCGKDVGYISPITKGGHHYLGTSIYYTDIMNGNIICQDCWSKNRNKLFDTSGSIDGREYEDHNWLK